LRAQLRVEKNVPLQADQVRAATARALAVIFLIMLMDIVGIMILSPVTAYIVQRYNSDALTVTLLTASYAAAQFFAAPLLGKLGDRYGRRPVLLISVFGAAVGYVIFGLGGALWVLFIGRIIGGITGGNLSTASAYIADVSRPEERAKNFTLIGMAWGLGLVIGPALGGALGQIALEAPAFAAAGLSLLNVLLGYFLLPESLPPERRETAHLRVRDLNPLVAIGQMARKPGMALPLLVMCLFNFAFNAINSTETLFLIQKFDAQPWHIGLQLGLLGIALGVVQVALIPRLVPRYGEKNIAFVSMLGQAVGAVLTFLTPVFWTIYPITVISRGVSGFIFPTLTSLTTERVTPQEMGALMGVTTAIGSLMSVFGPLWGGAVFDYVMPGAPYWTGAVVYVLAAIVLARVRAAPKTA